MQLTITKSSNISTQDALVVLGNEAVKWSKYGFSKDESEYIEREMKGKKPILAINQYKRWVFIVKLIKKDSNEKTHEALRQAGEKVCNYLNQAKQSKVYVVDANNNGEDMVALLEGIVLSNYQFLKYKTKTDKVKNSISAIYLNAVRVSDRRLELLNIALDAVCRARDLVNEPLIHLTANKLSDEFVKLGKEANFSVEVFNKTKIQSLKMGGLLAVNAGSIDPPTFTVMEYKPKNAKNKKPYILVGKGVVYDTGGLSLKPTANSMDYMKSDMAGSAAVSCTLYAIAKAKLPLHVIALVPATDNRPGGNAITPGDVITMHSGKTVEILNTDAEGRLILGDALSYAKKYDPLLVMDFATLTGSAAAAVGQYGIVCMGTADEKTKDKLKQSGINTHERLAEFPFWDEYDELIESDIADIKNIGGPYAGAITAGKFLQHFVDYPWMHFDIAGVSFLHKTDSYRGKNATGYGVRMLFDFFKNLS